MTLSEYQKKKYGSKGLKTGTTNKGTKTNKDDSEPSSFAEARYRVLVNDYDEYNKTINSFGNKYRSSDSFSSMSQRLNNLEERRTSLDNYFTKNKYYDKNKSLSESMAALRTFGQNARNYENDSQKFWSQFANEGAYNYAVKQSEKQRRYSAMTDEDLSAEIKRLSDEKESFKKKNGGKILNNFGKWYSNLDNEYGNTELKNAYDSNIRAIEDYDREIDLAKREKANRVFAEIDKLPEDVRNMLGEYVKADYEEDVKNINSVFEDPRYAEQKKNDRFYQQYAAEQISKKEKLKKNISDKLSALGYDPDKLIDYERFRYDETEAGRNKEYYAKLAAEHPVITSIGTVLASPAKGIGVLGTVTDFATDSEMPANGNSPYYYLNDFTDATRESVMENTNWNGPYTEHDYFDGLYSMLMSSGDSILAGLMGGPKAGGAIIGLSAMSEGAQKIAQKGGSKELALTVGLLNGINEGLWEAISLGQFSILKEKKIKKLLSSEGMKTVVGNLMKSAGVNASEEFNTEVANIIIDYALSGNLSDYEQAYEAVRAQGMSEEEARKAAAMKMTDQALEAGYGGALQGLFMGAGATVISAVKSDAQRVAYGKSISAEERAEMYDEARAAGVDESLINKIIAADENSRARVDAANEKAVNKARAAAEKNGGEFDEASVPQKPYYNRASDARRIAQLAEAIDEANVSKIYENAEKLGINTDEYDRNSESDVNVLAEQTVSELGRILESENAAAELEARGFEIETAPAANTETKEFHRSVVEAQQIAHPTVEIDGAAQRIDSFKSVGSGAAVTAENGKTVPVTQISGSAGEVFRAAAGYSSVKTANGFVDNYAYKYRGADLAEYKEAFDTYYTAGLKGVGSFIGADRYNTRFHDVIDAAAREQIYKLGRSERSFTPGVNKMYQQKSLSRTQQTQLEILDTIGKKYNLAFIVADRLTEGNGVGGDLNGVQIGGTNRIAISLDAEGQLYLRTAGHECYHFIEERNKAAADELHAFVIEKLKSIDGYDYNGQIDRIGRLYGLDKNNSEDLRKIESEIVADSMFDVFSDEKTVRELTGQNRSLAEKIRDFLADFISNIKAMIKKYTGSAELEALRDQCEMLEDIRSSFLSALEEASENFEAGSGDKVSGGSRYSRKQQTENSGSGENNIKDYDKPITLNDIRKLREAFPDRKSIADFTDEDIEKTAKWAYKYYGLMKERSPFFRRWFGEWRAYDETPINIAKQQGKARGAAKNADTNWNINISAKVYDETLTHNSRKSRNARRFLPFLESIIKNAVLFDSVTSDKGGNSVFYHYLYALADIGNGAELLKLEVEEMYDPTAKDDNFRAYKLLAFEKKQPAVIGSQNSTVSPISQIALIRNIADLYSFVKQYDKDFHPGKSVSPELLNTDRTPKVLYHQTDNDFTVFDVRHEGAGTRDNGTPFGIFMKSKPDNIGLKGKKQMKLYASMQNPLIVADRQQLLNKITSISPEYKNVIEKINSLDERYKAKFEEAKRDFVTFISEWRKNNPNAGRADIYQDPQFDEKFSAEEKITEEWTEEASKLDKQAKDILTTALKNGKYDGLIIRTDAGSFGRSTDAYIALEPAQVKSAETGEKANIGTFSGSKDIRHSRKQVTNAQQAIESNPYLEKMVADLKSQMKLTRGFVPERKAVREYARQIRSEYESSMSVDEISDAISEAFNIYKSMSDSEGYEYFKTHIVELAKRVLDSSRVLDEMNAAKSEMKKEFLKELKGRRFLLSPAQVEEIAYRYGSMKEFRRAWWGKGFYFSANEGTPIDTVWSDIVEASNGILDGDTVDVEQPVELVEAINGIDIEYGITDADMYNAQFQVLAAELFNTVSDLPSAKTFADKLTEKHYEELYRVKRENREALEKLKEEYELKNKSAMELVALEQRQRKEAQERSETTRKLTSLLKRVSSLAANGTKNNHIPQEFLSVTKQLLESFVYVGTKDREAISANLVKFQTEYEALADKSGDNSSLVYDDHIAAEIASLIKTVTSTKNAVHTRDIRFMTNTEIELVYNTVKMVAQRISTANKRFAEGRNATVEETAESIAGELKAPRRYGNNPVAAAANEKLGNTVWSLLKPVFAFERIGSNTFYELYEDLRAGQDVYANDTYEAQAYQTELAKKYHKLDWSDKPITVEFAAGGKHELTVQQLMFIYIAAQREAYKGHLFDGGFVYEDKIRREKGRNKKGKEKEYKISDAEAHKLTEADIEMVSELLTEEQKDYAEAMRDYLAKDLAEKGNSVTRKLYDMNKFIDDKYFPIMSSSEFLEFKAGSNPNYKSVLNAGMTKDLVQGANNPIVLSDFDSVWAKHVIDMTVYHSFALPLDDFNRVYNYTTKKNGAVSSIKTFLNTSCGEGATKYIETFIRDLNGGVKTDSAGIMDKLTSLFKKGAVFASASVTIQQPSAIMRATALLDTKYIAKTVLQKRDVDEMLEYCPVAKIKAMGFFDVSVSPNSSEWLTSADPQTLKQKIKAFFDVKDSNYRDEILSKAPALADDITWAHIWNAVKAETADKTSYKGEDLLKASAQRFAEIIDKTQVYDSVFSRSEIMRSKNSLAKMATAFMAEPTVSLNMAIEAGREIKSGNYKYGARVVGSIVSATVLNALLKAIILAMRDDDDDESIIEKYFGAFVDSFTGDLNPASYIPVIKDIDSIFHGYDIERTDMSVFSDLYNAIKQLDSGTVTTYKKVENFAGAIAAFAGLPVKNVMRDIRSVINLFGDIAAKNETTSEGMYKAFTEGVSGDWILGAIFKTASNSDRLYDAIRNGDMAEYNRLVKTYKSAASAQKAISDGIAANDERVMKAVEAKNNNEIALYVKYISEIEADGFSRKQIKSAVDSIISAEISDLYKHDNRIEQAYEAYAEGNISEYNRLVAAVVADGHSESAVKKAIEHFEEDAPSNKEVSLFSYADMNAAIETGGDYMTIIDDMIDTAKQNGKSEEDAEKSVRSALTEYWKDVYISASGSEQAAIRSKLEKTGIYDDVDETVTKWLVNSLKEDYKAAKTDAERERIRSRLYDTGYYESYEKLNKALVGDEVEELKEAYHKAANDYDRSVIREKIYNTGYYESYDDLNKALVKPEVEELKKAWLNAADESERAIIRERIFDTGYYKSYSTLDRTLKGLQK